MSGDRHSHCNNKIELLILTREEDYKELATKIAEIQKQLSGRVDGLARRLADLEEKMARSRNLGRSLSK